MRNVKVKKPGSKVRTEAERSQVHRQLKRTVGYQTHSTKSMNGN